MRGHGAATRDFVDSAGLTLLEHIFDHTDATADIRRRCVTFVTDLVTDARLHGTGVLPSIDLTRWCGPVTALLADPHPTSIDKALQAIDVLQGTCPNHHAAMDVAAANLDALHADALAAGDSPEHLLDLKAALARLRS